MLKVQNLSAFAKSYPFDFGGHGELHQEEAVSIVY